MSKEILEQYLDDYFQKHCIDSTETQEADKKANEYIAKINNVDDAWEADWWYTQAVYQHERQGFFGGFMCAMQLLGRKAGVVA